MPHVPALVTPALLKWARDTAGYDVDEAAQKMDVPAERLMSWESGESQPTIAQAKKLAAVYNRSLAVFYLPYPPGTAAPLPDYRRLSAVNNGLSPKLRYEIRKALYRREVAVQVLEEQEESPPLFQIGASIDELSEVVSRRLRDSLGMPIHEQIKWKTLNQALKAWTIAIENLGVLVFQTQGGPWGVTEDEMWGASIYEPVLPIVLINGRIAPAGKIFTLMHEYVHLALRTSGVCDMDEREEIEVFCNRVAGEILIPTPVLIDALKQSDVTGGYSDEQIGTLADQYSVSRDVVARRLLILGQISKEFYQAKHDQYLREFLQLKEARRAETKKPFPIQQHTMILRNNGTRYTGIILDAYHNNVISLAQVSRYLDMSLRYFDRVQDAVMASS